MTETPEPDVPTQLKAIGKKYLRFISLALDSVTQDIEQDIKPTLRVPRAKRALPKKPVAKPRTQNLGIARWLKGPKVEEQRSS